MRRIGVLMPFDEDDPAWKTRHSAFVQALAGLGWTEGRFEIAIGSGIRKNDLQAQLTRRRLQVWNEELGRH